MEKENVLEIEITKINDKWSAITVKEIKEEIKKDFRNSDLFEWISIGGNYLCDGKIFINHNYSDIPFLLKNETIECLEDIVNKINEKYGIPKRWEPQLKENFFIIERVRTEVSFKWVVTDLIYKNDHWIDFYAINSGNCFKTYEEAEKVVLKLEDLGKNFWAKVRAGEIGGDE